ncbi:heptaprenyl diphosphate synthase component 1 [Bacillus sp. MRMR6]|uniref:heptaprenyl diphosphate synthase component 1 n=1 Tax=Bacillus sp. MRMR6 TaxID=1928617 RepID=UPI000951B670|nr:heptaprenyl diphosphate synthase component 1 [Bacillus sp. MRMR6]OLS40236.1 heptaprenyl diphosphate synthase [Bacillus sp. MRMR6]
MIRLPNIRQNYTDTKRLVEQRVYHPYLLKFIETPIIDDDKLLILVSMLERQKFSSSDIQTYALTTMLIQIALDTHEHISNKDVDEKSRQLTVLAGDYYSGLYYKLLAQAEDIGLIRELSKGIKEVNEHKIIIYQKETIGIEQLMVSIKKIESAIFNKYSGYFQVEFWNDFIENFLFIKRLIREKRHFVENGESFLFDALKALMYPGYSSKVKLSEEQTKHLITICDDYINESKDEIKGTSQHTFINDMIKERIEMIMNEKQPIVKL